MCITSPWKNAIIDLDYTQDLSFSCVLSSSGVIVSDEVLNLNVTHDLAISQSAERKLLLVTLGIA
jgi:hypothetical protein